VRLERFNLSTANATGCGIVFTIAYQNDLNNSFLHLAQCYRLFNILSPVKTIPGCNIVFHYIYIDDPDESDTNNLCT